MNSCGHKRYINTIRRLVTKVDPIYISETLKNIKNERIRDLISNSILKENPNFFNIQQERNVLSTHAKVRFQNTMDFVLPKSPLILSSGIQKREEKNSRNITAQQSLPSLYQDNLGEAEVTNQRKTAAIVRTRGINKKLSSIRSNPILESSILRHARSQRIKSCFTKL